MSKISIIMPVYNGEAYVKNSIRRVIEQNFKDWDLIVINDGSTDNSLQILEDISRLDSRIKVYSQENEGICAARNAGLERADGKYIAFVDQDDLLRADMLGILFSGMKEDVDMVVAGKQLNMIDSENQPIKQIVCNYRDEMISEQAEVCEFIFNENNDKSSLHLWNCLYRREIIESHNLRFDTFFKCGMEDTLFNIAYALNCKKIHKIPIVVYEYYRKIGSSTSTKKNMNACLDYEHFISKVQELVFKKYRNEVEKQFSVFALKHACHTIKDNLIRDSLFSKIPIVCRSYRMASVCKLRLKDIPDNSSRKYVYYLLDKLIRFCAIFD